VSSVFFNWISLPAPESKSSGQTFAKFKFPSESRPVILSAERRCQRTRRPLWILAQCSRHTTSPPRIPNDGKTHQSNVPNLVPATADARIGIPYCKTSVSTLTKKQLGPRKLSKTKKILWELSVMEYSGNSIRPHVGIDVVL